MTSDSKTDGYDQQEWTIVTQTLECPQCSRRFRSVETTTRVMGREQGTVLTWTPEGPVAPAAAKHAALAAELAALEAQSGPKLW